MKDFEYRDYYRALGIKPGANTDEIKRAYRKLARANHPDFNPSDRTCEDRLKEINLSYETLMDPALRRRVDSWLSGPGSGYFEKSAVVREAEEEEPFCLETRLNQEWIKAVRAAKWAALFFLPPAFYVFSGKNGALHEFLKVIVILFVGAFYGAMVMTGKAVFHGATVWVMRSAENGRVRLQALVVSLAFALPLVYFVGGTKDWPASAERFVNHTWIWFMFAVVIISLTWTLGAFYRSPMISRFPFRFYLLAVYLTFVIAFCKAIPMADKGEALFDYVFFNIAIQTGLFLSIRANRRAWKTP